MRQGQDAEAEQQLTRAAELDARSIEVFSDLAIVAAKNQKPSFAIQALEARSKLGAAETPATYFLRATSYDHLQQKPLAVENYRHFLAAAQGRFPDQEWQARQRLKLLERSR